MKTWILTALLALAGTVTCAQAPIPSWKIGDLESYLRKERNPVIVNLWATFCRPCVQEIPYFQSTIQSTTGGKVDLLLVSLDLGTFYPDKIAAFAQKQHFTAPIVWLNETDADVFGPKIDPKWTGVLPSSIFYNPKTGYRRFYMGQLSPEQFKTALDGLLRH